MKRALLLLVLVGCGGDDGGGGGGDELSCNLIPSCYTAAITSLRACVTTPDMALGTPVDNSGVVDGLTCTGGDETITFSTFSTSPNGTVPLPSMTTMQKDGLLCATLHHSTGTKNGAQYESTEIEIPGGTETVAINRYANGDIGVECGPAEITTAASKLAACAAQIVKPDVFRDDAITMMGVDLVDAADASTPLFTCTR
jgi:hypothetical protein